MTLYAFDHFFSSLPPYLFFRLHTPQLKSSFDNPTSSLFLPVLALLLSSVAVIYRCVFASVTLLFLWIHLIVHLSFAGALGHPRLASMPSST